MGNTQTQERKRVRRGLVCEVGHDGEARVGFGREVMAQKKFVTYFPGTKKSASLCVCRRFNKKK